MKQIYIDKFLEGCELDDSELDDSERESEEQLMSVLQKLPDEVFETTMQIKSDLNEKGLIYASREFWSLCRKYLSDDKALMQLITQLEEDKKLNDKLRSIHSFEKQKKRQIKKGK